MSRKYYYAKSAKGFFISDLYLGVIPTDAVELTAEHYESLFQGQTNGKLITENDEGYPVLVDYPPPLAEEVRVVRNAMLRDTDWTQANDVPQATREKWVLYRQALRDVPEQDGFPENVEWPVAPN